MTNPTNPTPTAENIASYFVSFHDNIANALKSLSTTQLDHLKNDLNNPNKPINDILADLAVDLKYDGTTTDANGNTTTQTVKSLTSVQMTSIANTSHTGKFQSKETELTNKTTELNNVAELLGCRINKDVNFIERGEVIFDPEEVKIVSLFDVSGSGSFDKKANGYKITSSVTENATEHKQTEITIINSNNKKQIRVDIIDSSGINFLVSPPQNSTTSDYSEPGFIGKNIQYLWNRETEKTTGSNGNSVTKSIKIVGNPETLEAELVLSDSSDPNNKKTFKKPQSNDLTATNSSSGVSKYTYTPAGNNGSSPAPEYIEVTMKNLDNTSRELRFKVDNDTYLTLRVNKVTTYDFDSEKRSYGDNMYSFNVLGQSNKLIDLNRMKSNYKLSHIEVTLDKMLFIGKEAKLTIKNTTVNMSQDLPIAIFGNYRGKLLPSPASTSQPSVIGNGTYVLLYMIHLYTNYMVSTRVVEDVLYDIDNLKELNSAELAKIKDRIIIQNSNFMSPKALNGVVNLINVDHSEFDFSGTNLNAPQGSYPTLVSIGGNTQLSTLQCKSLVGSYEEQQSSLTKIDPEGIYKLRENRYIDVNKNGVDLTYIKTDGLDMSFIWNNDIKMYEHQGTTSSKLFILKHKRGWYNPDPQTGGYTDAILADPVTGKNTIYHSSMFWHDDNTGQISHLGIIGYDIKHTYWNLYLGATPKMNKKIEDDGKLTSGLPFKIIQSTNTSVPNLPNAFINVDVGGDTLHYANIRYETPEQTNTFESIYQQGYLPGNTQLDTSYPYYYNAILGSTIAKYDSIRELFNGLKTSGNLDRTKVNASSLSIQDIGLFNSTEKAALIAYANGDSRKVNEVIPADDKLKTLFTNNFDDLSVNEKNNISGIRNDTRPKVVIGELQYVVEFQGLPKVQEDMPNNPDVLLTAAKLASSSTSGVHWKKFVRVIYNRYYNNASQLGLLSSWTPQAIINHAENNFKIAMTANNVTAYNDLKKISSLQYFNPESRQMYGFLIKYDSSKQEEFAAEVGQPSASANIAQYFDSLDPNNPSQLEQLKTNIMPLKRNYLITSIVTNRIDTILRDNPILREGLPAKPPAGSQNQQSGYGYYDDGMYWYVFRKNVQQGDIEVAMDNTGWYKTVYPSLSGAANLPEGTIIGKTDQILSSLQIKASDLETVSETNTGAQAPASINNDNTNTRLSATTVNATTTKKVYKNDKVRKILGDLTISPDITEDFEIKIPNLDSIGGKLDLTSNTNESDTTSKGGKKHLTKLELDKLTNVEKDIIIENKKLKQINMPKLIRCKNMKIKKSDVLTKVDLSLLETVSGDVEIDGNKAMTEMKMPKLKTVGKNMKVMNNVDLVKMELNMLETVSEDVDIDGNIKMTEMKMPKLKMVGKNMKIKRNNKLPKLDLEALETVKEDMDIDGNKKMIEMKMPKLKDIKNMNVKNNDDLAKLDVEALETVKGDMDIEKNNKLKMIMMNKLKNVGNMKIKPNEEITNDQDKMVVEIPEETLDKITKDISPNKMKFKKYKKENGTIKMENGKPVMEDYQPKSQSQTQAPASRGQVEVRRGDGGRRGRQ